MVQLPGGHAAACRWPDSLSYYDYMSNEDKSTFTMPLAGRPVEFRRATSGQVIMLQKLYLRAVKRSEETDEQDERISLVGSAMVRVLDFIESLMVNEADREFVEDKMLTGEIDYPELLEALGGGKKVDQDPDDEEPKTRKAVRKSPKAAPAKKVARGSAKR